MTVYKEVMAPAEIARAILSTYPGSALDVALEVVRRVSRQQALDAVVTLSGHAAKGIVRPRPDSSAAIVAAVCAHYDITEAELKSCSKKRRVAHPRMMCWALIRDRLCLSLQDIALRYDRDHTTVLDGIRRVDKESSDWVELNRRLDAAQMGSVDAEEAA